MTDQFTDITITPEHTVYIVDVRDAPHDSGRLTTYAAATDARINDGTLTMLAVDAVLDTFGPGEWGFVGRVNIAAGHYEVERDGRAVVSA